MLFSGDSDMQAPLERLKVKGKKIGIIGVRDMVAGELHRVKDKYIDFGKFYTGKRTYIESENPAFGGTAWLVDFRLHFQYIKANNACQ